MSQFAVANFVDLIELLVEHLMHLKWGALVGVHTQDGLSQAKSVLEIALVQFLVCLHQGADIVELAIDVVRDHLVLVAQYTSFEVILILVDKNLKILTATEVSKDREFQSADTLVILGFVVAFEFLEAVSHLYNQAGQSQLRVHFY